jgi:hypothetical protein
LLRRTTSEILKADRGAIMRHVLAIAIGLALTIAFGWMGVSYSKNADISGWVPKAELGAAEHVTDLIRARRTDEARAALDPRVHWDSPDAPGKMADFFPKNVPIKTRVTNWQTAWRAPINGQTSGHKLIQIHYDFPDGRSVLASFLFESAGGKETMIGINFVPLTAEHNRIGEFHLQGMSGIQAVILIAAILLETFAFATFVICLMGPQPRWRIRWLWAILTLIGVFRLNAVWWTPGQLTFVPISVLFPPVGMTQVPIGTPWVFGFSLPLGAILYWLFRTRLRWDRRAQEPDLRVSTTAAPGSV